MTPAVSVRRMRGPKEARAAPPAAISSTSAAVHPPSGPTAIDACSRRGPANTRPIGEAPSEVSRTIETPFRRPSLERKLRHDEPAALLAGLEEDAPVAREARGGRARRLGALTFDEVKGRDADLGPLLEEVVELFGANERLHERDEDRSFAPPPGRSSQGQGRRVARHLAHGRLPLASAAVEREDPVPGTRAQNADQVMRLLGVGL
jgi:hypothetical protein